MMLWYILAKKNELIFKDMKLNRVNIQLFEVMKTTGDIKDTFKFTYQGREYRRLSLSEQIKTGLEIVELLKQLSNRKYPTFIDNAESVCVIDNVRSQDQMVLSYARKGQPLQILFKKDGVLKKTG